jgi:carboxyl-terminal processing protease
VQTIMPLPGHGAMRLTTARYYTPSGRSIQAKGIEPDILVEPARIETIDRPTGMRSEADLRNALDNTDKAKKDGAADKSKEDGSKAKGDDETSAARDDYQLSRALDLIRGLALYRSKDVHE